MKMKSMVAAMTVVASCGLVWAGTATSAAAAGTASIEQPNAKDTSRRVCRRLQPTGSRLAERTCRTQAEWDEIAEAARQAMRTSEREDTVGHNPELNGTNPK